MKMQDSEFYFNKEMYLFFFFSALFNALTSLGLGIFVFSKNGRNETNRIFVYLCLAVSIWSFFYLGWPLSKTSESALFWFRLLHIGAAFTPITYFHFVVSWLGIGKRNKFFIRFGYVLSLVFSFLVFSPFFITEMIPKFHMRFWAEPGIAYHFYLLYFFFYFIFSSILLCLNYQRSSGIKKKQIFYLMVGMILSIIGGSTNYFLWYDINIPPYGNILAGSFVIFSAYAMVKYRFMDIRIVAKKSFIYFGSMVFSFLFLLAMLWSFKGLLESSIRFNFFILSAVIAIIFTASFYLVEGLLRNLANKHFFVDLYNYQEAIRSVAQELTRHNNPTKIAVLIFETIKNTIPVTKIGIFFSNSEKIDDQRYQAIKIAGFNKDFCQRALKNAFLIKYLGRTACPLVVEELLFLSETSSHAKEQDDLMNVSLQLGACRASICLPMIVEKKVIGMILLGQKISGDAYSKEDLALLSTLADQSGVALNNAMLYQQVKNFNKALQEKVDRQTRQLQKEAKELEEKNENLNKLLAVKNEFLKIVNHQINTPLSIIKNSVFMIRNKSFTLEKGLSFVDEGTKRIDDVLSEFWRAFYVGGEGVKLKPKKLDIVKLADKIIADYAMADKVKSGQVVINFNKGEKIPVVKADPVQLSQVFSNLIDNSLCYTKAGYIKVDIQKNIDFVKVTVSDTGQGIEKKDLSHLFEKFFRSAAAKKTQPGGSGLGLYIIKKIVEAGGGVMKLEKTEVDKGTTFSFTVPIWKE
jgi:signal transduction histidine kinase